MSLIKVEGGSHFYDKDGNPQYDADLRTAKKNGYLPSITTIMKIINKEALNSWKIEQMMLSAMTSVREPDENEFEFIQRVIATSQEESLKAAEYGSNIHKMIENYISIGGVELDDYTQREREAFNAVKVKFIDPMIKYGECESPFADDTLGYGGKADFLGVTNDGLITLIDWKTQNIKWKQFVRPTDDEYEVQLITDKYSRPVVTYYPEWIMQLAALANLIEVKKNIKIDRCMSVVINSDPENPTIIYTKEYSKEEIEWAGITFMSLVSFYRFYKKY